MNKNLLTVVITILGFILYVICIALLFTEAFEKLVLNAPDDTNKVLQYFATGLTTMTGGIIAVIFGLPKPDNQNSPEIALTQFSNIGSILHFGDNEKYKMILGGAYTIFYVLVGFAAILFWITFSDSTTSGITNVATAFFGLLIPIISNFFKP